MSGDPNRAMLERVAQELGPLLSDLVFVGGQVTALLVTDRAAVRVRPTTDVDVIVSANTMSGFHLVEARVRELGFVNDLRDNAPLCRWISPSGAVLDVMPDSEAVLGFANRWYGEAVRRTVAHVLRPRVVIQHPTAPVFLATKLAAFRSRGAGDVYGSHDLEDVITLVAGRAEIVAEMQAEPDELRTWVGEEIGELLRNPEMHAAIQGALPDVTSIPGYMDRVLARFEFLAR